MNVETKSKQNTEVLTGEDVQFTASFFIAKTFYQENFEFKIALTKAMSRVGKAHYRYARELNTFMVAHCDILPEYATLERQELLESALKKIHKDYIEKITKRIRNLVWKDTEITESKKAIQKAHKFYKQADPEAFTQYIRLTIDGIQRVVLHNLQEAVSQTQVLLWENPNNNSCRLITKDKLFSETYPELKPGEFSGLTDEITLLVLSKTYLRLLEPLSTNLINITDFFNKITGMISIDLSKPGISSAHIDSIAETIRVLLGKLLGIRESLRSATRQINRFTTLTNELEETESDVEKKVLDTMVTEYLNQKDVAKRDSELNQLSELLSELIPKIRDMISKVEIRKISSDASIEAENQHITSIVDFYAELEKLRFFVDLFEDIPYFTLMPGGIAFETEEFQGLPFYKAFIKRISSVFQRKKIEHDSTIDEDVILKADSLFKTYRLANSTVYALRGVSFEIRRGEFVAITGSSGSGKTTLLNIISGLDTTDRGAVFLDRRDISHMDDKELTAIRRDKMGFIFQYYNLLPVLTTKENVKLPAELGGDNLKGKKLDKKAEGLLENVQLKQFQNQIPTKLSGGQMQRVTIARSMINSPDILFADEPTGDLDSKTGHEIMNLISAFHKQGSSIVMVTHDPEIAMMADRIIEVRDGQIIRDVVPS